MDTIVFSKAQSELAGLLDRVNADASAVEIVRSDKPSAVLIGKDEYDSLMETIHLLSSPVNAQRLFKGKAEIEQGAYEIRDISSTLGS
ncbi:MAG: type II toxin-antitoxin system Phd/YefM family antitoxin [Allorhizobium sp.]